MKLINFLLSTVFVSSIGFSQINVTNVQTPNDLVNDVLAGPGVTILNLTYNGSAANGLNAQPQAGYFNSNGSAFPLSEGVVLSTGNVSEASNNETFFASTGYSGPSDVDLATFGAGAINDAVSIEFDFIPVGDSVSFNFVFASEEYPSFAPPNGGINDVFGFFLSGPGIAGPYSNGAENIAVLPNGDDISINNINPVTNSSFYVSNSGGTSHPYGGRSTVLTTVLPTLLECGETYHFKIVLADASDDVYDTAIFLEANSFTSSGADISIIPTDSNGDPLVNNELYEGCTSAQIVMVNPAGYTDSSYVVNIVTSGTAINGTDYSTINTAYTIPPGSDSLVVNINSLSDALPEGTETLIIETYYISECNDTVWITETINILDVAPSFNVLDMDTVFTCPFNTLDLNALTDGGVPNLTYDWGVTGSTQIVSVPADVPGLTTYVVDVVDACGITSQGTFNVTLNAAPEPDLTINPPFATICPGEEQVFDVVAVNNSFDPGNETYNWFPQPSNTSDVTVSPQVTTWYYVEVFDGCYTVLDSVKATTGSAELTAINTVDALNCPGQAAPSLGEIEILPNMGGWNYTITGAGVTTGPQLGNTFTGLTGGITYFIHVEDANGCAVDTSVLVENDFTQVEADWILSSLDSVTCFGDQDGTAEIQNISGGLFGGPFEITWTSQTGESSSVGAVTGGGDAVDTLYGGDWVVTVVETHPQSGCAWSQVFEVYEPNELAITFASSEPSCFGLDDGDLTVQITGGNSITSAVLTNSSNEIDPDFGPSSLTANSLETDTYTVVVNDVKGCTNTESILLDQPGEIAIDFTLTNPLCYGVESGIVNIDTVYNYQGVDYDSLVYYWVPDPNGNNGYGIDLGNNLRFVAEGSYELKITDGNGCYKFFDFEIEYPDSIYFDELGFDYAICRNQIPFDNGQGQVYAAAAGGSDGNGNGTNFTYQWTEESTGNTTTNSTWGNRNPGQFTIVATNDLGCQISETIYLDSLSPIAAFELTSDDFYAPYEGTAVVDVQLVNISSNFAFSEDPSADTTFIWSFGREGDTTYYSSDINEIINEQYLSEGVYDVCLIVVENLNGCTDTVCQEIIIHDFPTLVTPNVFTPGGDDDVNSSFYFPNTAISEFSASVYDRWGKQVFEFTNILDQWDGTNMKNGKMCSDGVYFYKYDGVSTDGTEFTGQGNVHLILK